MTISRPPLSFTVAPGVYGFRSVLANYFFVSASDSSGWVLVDTGLQWSARRLLAEAHRRFGHTSPRAIVLTHGHFDHVGALPRLAEEWSCRVYAHTDELPFLNEGQPYPAPDPSVRGGLMARRSPLFPRRVNAHGPRVNALPADGTVPFLPGWRWLPTPGHSPGHVSLWRETDRVLLAGDAVVNTRQESLAAVWSQREEIRPPPAYFTPNWTLAYESLLRLSVLQPNVLASGHGLPASGPQMRRDLSQLAADFAERGLPRRGHYVRETWAPFAPSQTGA